MNKGVWNLGGDLEYFVDCIKNNNKTNLKDYAYKCIELVYNYNSNYELDIFSACVIQGNAFGGGFESALSGNYIIAEESAKFSFPEVVFGTFPGMGAYSFLTKKVGFQKASEIINSNKTFSAQDIHDLGIINKVCEDGLGIATMSMLIKRGEVEKILSNPFLNICNKVPKKELLDVVDVWLEKSFLLSEDNLNKMLKLANLQKRKIEQIKQIEPNHVDELRLSEVDSLINNSF